MCRHCSDGSSCRAAVARYAAYCKLSERKVQYILRALCKRGVLTQRSEGNPARRQPAIYQINESAMEEDPRWKFSIEGKGRRVAEYRTFQQDLPGIPRPWDPQIPDERLASQPGAQCAPVHGVQGTGAQNVLVGVHTVHQSSAQYAPDLKALDLRAVDPKESERESQKPLSLSIDCTQEEKLGSSAAASDETQLQRVLRLRRQEH
jgi:hypothetical protein